MTVCQNMHKNGRGGHPNNKDKIAAEAAGKRGRYGAFYGRDADEAVPAQA